MSQDNTDAPAATDERRVPRVDDPLPDTVQAALDEIELAGTKLAKISAGIDELHVKIRAQGETRDPADVQQRRNLFFAKKMIQVRKFKVQAHLGVLKREERARRHEIDSKMWQDKYATKQKLFVLTAKKMLPAEQFEAIWDRVNVEHPDLQS